MLSISQTTIKAPAGMNVSKKISSKAIEAEWEEIQAAKINPAKFRPLYNRYYEKIFRFVYRRTSDEFLSADITSQVFLKALQKLEKYQFKGVPFSSWLFRIASNEVTQYFRNTQKQRVINIETTHVAEMTNEIEDMPNGIQLESMIAALDYLGEGDLTLIELRFFEQRSFKEIAEITGVTESNAKVKTYRALAKLKKIMIKQVG